MSFITKRERVFNEYDLFDLPARNEGKLKAYASCTDARAWSHFCSDKSEHLVEIIKRNNETVRPKYLPTNVIVDTLMVAKNAEIARLKQKIAEFEQMLAAYDQLDLSCDQKCEIANAHAAIRAANKELDDMCLDLDLSGFTEAIDSEAFETGKSGGDGGEVTPHTYEVEEQEAYQRPLPTETKAVQMGTTPCKCDASTLVQDPRIEEMQDVIIGKDAKLNAMKNTIAVMENDVCEPYCIYAHIYTALEKIFGILCQNDKYRQYLNLLTAGKDIRCIDIKGKILFKLKVMEKFCGALIAPCNKDFNTPAHTSSAHDCECYRSEMTTCIETTFAMTSAEATHPNMDNKRAHLVADIIQNDEMKEILSKESFSVKQEESLIDDGYINDYNIDKENLLRLKTLQENYDDLMTCYESLKHEKECLETRCHKYEELEKEFENLKLQISEYNSLWNEKEHYRKRSMDLDVLKEQYFILTDETASLETALKAESEINKIKSKAIDEIRNENVHLEKKLNDARIAFEREKNSLLCKLKEADCRVMCQEQEIKSLSLQIDRLLEQDHQNLNSRELENNSIVLIDEVESYKDQIKNLKDALFCNEEEKQNLQQQYQDQLKLINDLKIEVEDWKSAYEKTLQRNDSLEKYTESLSEENKALSQDAKEKSQAVENLLNVINVKSQKINELLTEADERKKEIEDLRNNFDNSVTSLEKEKLEALQSLQLARDESKELLEKVKDYDQVLHMKADATKSLEVQLENKKELQSLLMSTVEENNSLKVDLANQTHENQKMREVNEFAADTINNLQNENKHYKTSIELTQKESDQLKRKLIHFENLTLQLQHLQDSHEILMEEKKRLENELLEKSYQLDKAKHSIHLTKRESDELMDKLQQSESAKDELLRLSEAYQKLVNEKHTVQKDLLEKKNNIEDLLQSLNSMKLQNERLLQKCREKDILKQELQDFKQAYNELVSEKKILQDDYNNKRDEFNHLYDVLEKKIEENRELNEQIKSLEGSHMAAKNSIKSLQDDNLTTKATLNVIRKESAELVNKIRQYELLETEYDQLKRAHDQMKEEKEKLQSELNMQLADLKRIEKENLELQNHSQNLLTHSEVLENALMSSRTELIKKTTSPDRSHKDILTEIEEMRREKLKNQKKIRDLLDKLDESENIISNLSNDVSARGNRIAILENHINELEDEVRKLHIDLAEVVETGEEMSDFSFRKLDSIKNMEAHHSKATHNMKMELAKLQHQNLRLEEQLSVTKIKSEESSRDNNRYVSQIINLQNEREIIVTDIKQLELKTVGDSALGPNNCDVEEILVSLERIRKAMDAKTSKSISLEQTILKVQTSSQLLLSKADEAKRLVEKEKQKIVTEKEEAIKDKQNMENQLLDLKEKLEKQIANDKKIIKDLEATILNQKLIIDKINQSTQDYISKLKEELQTIQNLYQNSMEKISELQEKLQNVTEDRTNQINMLNQIKGDFDAQSMEVSVLQKELEELKNKTISNIGTQTKMKIFHNNMATQINKELLNNDAPQIHYDDIGSMTKERKGQVILNLENMNTLELNKSTQHKQRPEPPAKQKDMRMNDVQVLTAEVEPTFNYVRHTYMTYKLKCLSHGKLEQYSISCLSDSELNEIPASGSPGTIPESIDSYSDAKTHDSNLIDIYNRHSMHTNSSKGNEVLENMLNRKQNRKKSNAVLEFSAASSNMNDKYKDSKTNKTATEPTSDKLPEKDLFVIYKDSQRSLNNREQATQDSMSLNYRKKREQIYDKQSFYQDEDEHDEESLVRQKLKINMPRIDNDSNSLINTSDGDKKSIDSDTLAFYSTSKGLSASDTKLYEDENGRNYKSSTSSLPVLSNTESLTRNKHSKPSAVQNEIKSDAKTNSGTLGQKQKISKNNGKSNESHHKLSRVGANALLLKNEKGLRASEDNIKQGVHDFGLKYIMDTVQGEVDPDKNKYFTKEIRSARSDEMFNVVRIKGDDTADSVSPTRLSDVNMTSTEYKTISILSKSSDRSQKTFTERSIMVKLDTNLDYENTISSLTKALENIERDYKKKIDAIKMQYDSNIKSIINEHNQGVKSIQGLHEETLQDIIKIHENEVENLRSMSIEAMRKADKLEKENRVLKTKVHDRGTTCLDEEPIKISTPEVKKRRKNRGEPRLTKTTVEAFNVKPKLKAHGPCTCSLDINVSDTIRNIFEQVDVEQRKLAENTYMKYIANKMMGGNVETLDAHELSFLHLKVCRMWKAKLSKEEALQKRIDSLESELLNKQRNAQQHIEELDRKVAEERRRLQEVREAVCRTTPQCSRAGSPAPEPKTGPMPPPPPTPIAEKEIAVCACNTDPCHVEVNVRGSAGDLAHSNLGLRSRRTTTRTDINRQGVLGKLDLEERREKKLYSDEPPTRLRRSHDRQIRSKK